MYDAVVAGGSISGLLAAREIAKGGYTVLVLEEGFEVGSPEHCGGLVSKIPSLSLLANLETPRQSTKYLHFISPFDVLTPSLIFS